MQSKLPLHVGHPLSSLTGLAAQIALPGESAPLRFPSFPALERTAVMGFNAPVPVVLPASTPVKMMVARQACYPVWAERATGFANVVRYDFPYLTTTSVGGMPKDVPISLTALRNIGRYTTYNQLADLSQVGVAGTSSTGEWKYPILAVDDALPGPEFCFIPGGSKAILIFACTNPFTGVEQVRVLLERWVAPGEVQSLTLDLGISATFTSGYVTFTPNATGAWYRVVSAVLQSTAATTVGSVFYAFMGWFSTSTLGPVSFTGSTGTNLGTINVSDYSTTARFLMPVATPAEFSNSQLPWFATRVTAAALLGTNVSQVLNKGGTILGGRVSPAVLNPWEVTSSYVGNLHPAEKAYLPLETGVYTYAPPSTDLVFFHDYSINTSGGLAPTPLYRLDNTSMVNVMFVTASAVDEQLALTASWHIEFRTSSALFQIGLSGLTLEALHAAQLILAEFGFFFENPNHTKLRGKLSSLAKQYGPSLIGMVNPVAGKIAAMGVKMLQAKSGPSKPPTTTAAASGITAKTPRRTAKTGHKGKGKKK